jgi:sulfate permease, SulP family
LLTVLVDLIVAVGVGVFIANILTIERLSKLQSQSVKTITDVDDKILLNSEEKQLLDKANGRVLLFHLSGPMIFGVAKAIAREQSAMKEADVLIVDLTDVPLLGVTASLAVENVVQEAISKGRPVFIVCETGQTKQRLKRLKVLDLVAPDHLTNDRLEALRMAVALVEGPATETSEFIVTP